MSRSCRRRVMKASLRSGCLGARAAEVASSGWLGARQNWCRRCCQCRAQLQSIPSRPSPSTPNLAILHPLFSPRCLLRALSSNHVQPTVSSPRAREPALYHSSTHRCPSYRQSAHCTQLLGNLKGDLVRSYGSGFKVRSAIEGAKTPQLTPTRRPGPFSTQRSWNLEQTRSYGMSYAAAYRNQVLTHAAADTVVKVPQMAESITEGTLKQWSKREFPAMALSWVLFSLAIRGTNNVQRLVTT